MPDRNFARRWYQFRIWQLLVLTAVVAIVCGMIVRIRRNRAQWEAMGVVWMLGGQTACADQPFLAPLSESDFVMRTRSHGWIDDLTGDDPPVAVRFPTDARLSDDDLDPLIAALQRMPKLQVVFLEEELVTADGLRRLRKALPSCEFQPQSSAATR